MCIPSAAAVATSITAAAAAASAAAVRAAATACGQTCRASSSATLLWWLLWGKLRLLLLLLLLLVVVVFLRDHHGVHVGRRQAVARWESAAQIDVLQCEAQGECLICCTLAYDIWMRKMSELKRGVCRACVCVGVCVCVRIRVCASACACVYIHWLRVCMSSVNERIKCVLHLLWILHVWIHHGVRHVRLHA